MADPRWRTGDRPPGGPEPSGRFRSRAKARLGRALVAVAAAAVAVVAGQPAYAAPAAPAGAPTAAVSPQLLAQLGTQGTAGFLVYLRDKADLSKAAKLTDSDAKATHVYQQLTRTAKDSQDGLLAALAAQGTEHRAFWIANAVWVNGDRATVDAIAKRPEVERIEPSRTYALLEPTARTAGAHTAAIEWGLNNIEAPRVWSDFGVRGEGIVVANIDSGVDFDHPALVRSYRGNNGDGTFNHNYNWFDPANICPGDDPCDNNSHGTHTMGTMVGDDGAGNQIGVAPAAKWIAAKGCETNGCSDASLLASGQWVLAPTDLTGANPRPDLHADVVNNSWGGGGGDLWYQATVRAWIAAGMFPAFASGNDGPACGSAGSPGDNVEAFAVGAYDISNNIAGFSGRGPSDVDSGIKPDIAAPGVNVRSSVPNGGYANFNGTSMATPHLSGAVALAWSAAPAIKGDVAATRALLDQTATDVNATTCGGDADDNNVFGEGRLNAFQLVTAAPRGPLGRIVGLVTDAATNAPLPGVTVSTGDRSATTGTDGRYTITVPVGTYTVTASKFGYVTGTATVTVAEGAATTQDFALVKARIVTVSGTVRDGSGHGWPLYARLDITGRPGGPVFTNPATGRYSFDVPANSSFPTTVTALYRGYQATSLTIATEDADKTVDITLKVAQDCTAAGYSASLSAPLLSESFDTTETPAGWSVVNRTPSGGWVFNDPHSRGNLTGGSGNFAIIDSDHLGVGNTQDTDLVTPTLNLADAGAPLLRFNSDWRAVGITDTADIDVSTDGGTTWSNVWHQTISRRGPRVEEVPLTPLANAANARIRFRFFGTFAWWWEVDNVQVVNRACTPVPGGLVVGFTSDRNTGAALNGVTVASVDAPADKGVSAPTPDDPNIPDGFYSLFSSVTGSHPFTATKAPYQPATRTVNVAADNATRADFALNAGRLTVAPTSIESHQPYGSTRSTTVKVTNTGTAPAEVELLERGGGFQMLGKQGAKLAEYTMKGLSKSATGIAYGAYGAPTGAAPSVDDAWTRIANYPVSIFDNSAASLDGKIYSVGGGTGSGNERKAWAYSPLDDAWTALPDMPNARSKPSVAAINGKLYVIGGWGPGSAPQASVDVFDPVAGAWSTLAGVTNPKPRAAAGTAVADGKVYLVGGCVDGPCNDAADTVVFDPAAGAFSEGAAYPHPSSWMSCGGVSGKVYCGGGIAAASHKDGWVYNPAAGEWTALPDMPIDLWGSQYSAAGGLLVISGGVTANSSAITNRAVAYDPAAGSWRDLPNAQFTRFRGAGACGFFKVGGSPSSFVGAPDSEKLGGLELCNEEADVPWLSTNPTTFTLAPGASRNVKVTFTATAAAGVLQPGTYTAQLGIGSNTPYPVSSVDVKMSVAPPSNWGKLQGTVQGERCDGTLVPVPATVRANLTSNPATGFTLRADNQGKYAYWVPRGRYEVIAAKDGWVPQVKRVQVSAGFVVTLDFVLDPVNPCTTGGVHR
ncbi:MAG TPA: S8 family serine peptidase [Pilimelia sp.]|nr:S8 family serine peptidase [Pilimelia sp.]